MQLEKDMVNRFYEITKQELLARKGSRGCRSPSISSVLEVALCRRVLGKHVCVCVCGRRRTTNTRGGGGRRELRNREWDVVGRRAPMRRVSGEGRARAIRMLLLRSVSRRWRAARGGRRPAAVTGRARGARRSRRAPGSEGHLYTGEWDQMALPRWGRVEAAPPPQRRPSCKHTHTHTPVGASSPLKKKGSARSARLRSGKARVRPVLRRASSSGKTTSTRRSSVCG